LAEDATLFELLERSGAWVRAYDIGRRIGALDRSGFLDFERALAPYPLPMQRKAWLALVQAPARATGDPVIWFLRLGLDEQGLLRQAERDYLLERLLASARARSRGDDPRAFLRDNPFAFTPREDRMALFHALLSSDLGLPPSRFYDHALDYFRGGPGWDQWGFVGYQGIADVACRHDDRPLSAAVAALPREPLVALCHCLESGQLSVSLEAALLARLQRVLEDEPGDVGLLAALVRGLSPNARGPAVRDAVSVLLRDPAGRSIEVLAAIAGRAWELLDHPRLLQAFLERLADNDQGQAAFEHCVGDLLGLPAVAPGLRRALRSPELPVSVREAFARMLEAAAPD
jgi:hypothetical protein